MNKLNPRQEQIIGFVLGLLLPILSLFLIFLVRPELLGVQRFNYEVIKQLNVGLLTFGMLLNAACFFLVLRFNKERMGNGILQSTVLLLFLMVIYKFLL
jgi:uncharacterized membrane protein YozB (DUF420 family)